MKDKDEETQQSVDEFWQENLESDINMEQEVYVLRSLKELVKPGSTREEITAQLLLELLRSADFDD